MPDPERFLGALRFKSYAALALLVRHSRRATELDPLMERVANRLPHLL